VVDVRGGQVGSGGACAGEGVVDQVCEIACVAIVVGEADRNVEEAITDLLVGDVQVLVGQEACP